MKIDKSLLEKLIDITFKAGSAILKVYNSDDFEVEMKEDDSFTSPLTKADKAANDVIEKKLKQISNYPIISEENETREVAGEYFWLVDPLDGTKEFIKRNGEFTINIALIYKSQPVLGVVYAPAIDVMYIGDVEAQQAYKVMDGIRSKIVSRFTGGVPKVVTSRSHKDKQTQKLLDAIGDHEEVSMGSSLKLCLVAEGAAMLYPRLAPTYLWDTAAADAVVRAAGGSVRDLGDDELVYSPAKNIKNPFFVASTANSLGWQKLL